jgi:hypothetical protein
LGPVADPQFDPYSSSERRGKITAEGLAVHQGIYNGYLSGLSCGF